MSKLRKSANGQPCRVRIAGICNFDLETTVLAHLNGSGMGRKHEDIWAAFACSSCHSVLDGRTLTHYTPGQIKRWHLEGMVRTQEWWLKNGLIKIGK